MNRVTFMVEKDFFEDFQQQLHTCLTHFYDYTFLFNHPFVMHIVPDEVGSDRVQQFREKVTQAIERLRPAPNITFHSKDARPYNVLNLRYIDQQETEDVIQRLALSRRQYFREHGRALAFLATMFLQPTDPHESIGLLLPPLERMISLETEIASLGQVNGHTHQDVGEIIEGVLEATARLATQYGVDIVPDASLQQVELIIDRTMLRQALLTVYSLIITNLTPGSEIWCSHKTSDTHLTLNFSLKNNKSEFVYLQSKISAVESLQTVLQAIKSKLGMTQSHHHKINIFIEIPFKPYNILVIDDNPDVIDLFRRYLTHYPYYLKAVHDGKMGVQIARELAPIVIILDLMLPHQDGYEILQNLKNHPQTSQIPVVICSVLETPELALSLGADGYLKKPPGQQQLLTILSNWLN